MNNIASMTDEEFRDWYYDLIASATMALIEKTKHESYGLPLDIATRRYLVGQLTTTNAFRRSGVEIVGREEVVA